MKDLSKNYASDPMKSIRLGEKFDLKIHECVAVEGENLVVTIKSVARLQVPMGGNHFILQLTLTRGSTLQEVNLDGSFQFPTNNIQVQRGEYRISVPDIDFMARFATLIIDRIDKAD